MVALTRASRARQPAPLKPRPTKHEAPVNKFQKLRRSLLAADDAGAQVSDEDPEYHPKQDRPRGLYDRLVDRLMMKNLPKLLKTGAHVLCKEEWKTKAGGLIKTEDDDVDMDKLTAWFLVLMAHSQPRRINRKGAKLGSLTEEHKANISKGLKKAWDPDTNKGKALQANLRRSRDPNTKKGKAWLANLRKSRDPNTKKGKAWLANVRKAAMKRRVPKHKQSANICKVDACNKALTTTSSIKRHVCVECMQAAEVIVNGAASRYCRRHNKFEVLQVFSGERRTCDRGVAADRECQKRRVEQQQQQQQQRPQVKKRRVEQQQQKQQQQRPQGKGQGEQQAAKAQQQQPPCRMGTQRKAAQACVAFMQNVAGTLME